VTQKVLTANVRKTPSVLVFKGDEGKKDPYADLDWFKADLVLSSGIPPMFGKKVPALMCFTRGVNLKDSNDCALRCSILIRSEDPLYRSEFETFFRLGTYCRNWNSMRTIGIPLIKKNK
jgi:hypothetical protein